MAPGYSTRSLRGMRLEYLPSTLCQCLGPTPFLCQCLGPTPFSRRKITRGPSASLDSLLKSFHTPVRAHHPPRFLWADAIQRGLWAIYSDIHRGIRHGVIGIAVRISALEEMRHDVPMLAAEKLPALVVESHAVLPFARLDVEDHGTRI